MLPPWLPPARRRRRASSPSIGRTAAHAKAQIPITHRPARSAACRAGQPVPAPPGALAAPHRPTPARPGHHETQARSHEVRPHHRSSSPHRGHHARGHGRLPLAWRGPASLWHGARLDATQPPRLTRRIAPWRRSHDHPARSRLRLHRVTCAHGPLDHGHPQNDTVASGQRAVTGICNTTPTMCHCQTTCAICRTSRPARCTPPAAHPPPAAGVRCCGRTGRPGTGVTGQPARRGWC